MITVAILTKNSESKIGQAIKSAKLLSGEILVLDNSTDKTSQIAKKLGARVVPQIGKGYSDWRNQAIKECKNEWIFYLDFDEQITQELASEIKTAVEDGRITSWAVPRLNIIFGKPMRHGGWWPDYVERLFKKSSLETWVGDLHERPKYKGELGYLENYLIHHKHDNISDMVEKTNKWSQIEAKLLFDANHPKMSWWRFVRIMKTELLYRLIVKGGILDGGAGIIYALYQMYSRYITYAKLWEMQLQSKNSKVKNQN